MAQLSPSLFPHNYYFLKNTFSELGILCMLTVFLFLQNSLPFFLVFEVDPLDMQYTPDQSAVALVRIFQFVAKFSDCKPGWQIVNWLAVYGAAMKTLWNPLQQKFWANSQLMRISQELSPDYAIKGYLNLVTIQLPGIVLSQ